MRTAALTLAGIWFLLGQAAPLYAVEVAGRGGTALQDVPRQADAPAPQPGGMEEPESTLQVRIESVSTLNDYAAVTRLLQATPGVRRVSVVLVDRSSVTFDVSVRGGAAGLEQALAGQPRFTHEGSAPVYRYQPGASPATAPSPP